MTASGHYSPCFPPLQKAKPQDWRTAPGQRYEEVLSQSQFPQVQDVDNDNAYFIAWLSGENEKMHMNFYETLYVKCLAHNNPSISIDVIHDPQTAPVTTPEAQPVLALKPLCAIRTSISYPLICSAGPPQSASLWDPK